MADTLTVALRVAEEAIEEAIAKAEEFSDSLVRLQSVSRAFSLSLPSLSSPHALPFSTPPPWFQYQRDAVTVSACDICTAQILLNTLHLCVCVQEKQNEARYLRDHKEELIEELATTIVQKVGLWRCLLFWAMPSSLF